MLLLARLGLPACRLLPCRVLLLGWAWPAASCRPPKCSPSQSETNHPLPCRPSVHSAHCACQQPPVSLSTELGARCAARGDGGPAERLPDVHQGAAGQALGAGGAPAGRGGGAKGRGAAPGVAARGWALLGYGMLLRAVGWVVGWWVAAGRARGRTTTRLQRPSPHTRSLVRRRGCSPGRFTHRGGLLAGFWIDASQLTT